jgi:hypothetical protein
MYELACEYAFFAPFWGGRIPALEDSEDSGLGKNLASGRFWCWEDSGLGKILALGRFWRWEDSALGKIPALGRFWRWEDSGLGNILAQAGFGC